MTTQASAPRNRTSSKHGGQPVERSGHRARRARPFRLTDRDLELLEFVAAQRFVLAAHTRRWLGASDVVAYRRLSGLVDVGLLSYRRIFHAQPGCYLVTNGGLAVIDSELPRPTIDLRTYRHDLGVVWLWLAAHDGQFGSVEQLLTERQMRSHDQGAGVTAIERVGVPVEGYDRSGRPRIHYPDVLVVAPDGGRVALELELSVKGRRRLERILVGYSCERRVRSAVYLTDSRAVAAAVNDRALACGVERLVDVRYFPLSKLGAASWPDPLSGGRVR